MKLDSIKYSQFDNEPNEWNLDLIELGEINLIVGKNATGKTKTLHLINNFAKLLCGELKPTLLSANFDAQFEHEGKNYRYKVCIKNNAVIEEFFQNETKIFLSRSKNGEGKIWAERQNCDLDFQTPTSDLAITARRDSIQHPYIIPLYEWAKSVYHYGFGTSLGKDTFQFTQQEETSLEIDAKNAMMVVGIFKKGDKEFGEEFKNLIIQDMKTIAYDIEDIGTAPPSHIFNQIPSEGLWVQENDLKSKTEQWEISQGMFRALSLVIQLNYSKMALKPSCILIDDIGEGLDFERSCALIELLIDKVKGSAIQLVMATNDRFVMNKVPLETWTVLRRENSRCRIFNIKNSKKIFDDFRFTGLNNFDFLATDYLAESKK